MPSGRPSSSRVSAIASFVPLRLVGIAGFCGGSDTLASLGASAVWFCHGSRCHCSVLCDCQRGLVLLLSDVAGWFPNLTSWPLGSLSQCAEWPVLFSLGFPPPLLSSISTLSALQVSVVVPSGYLLRYRVESSRCGPPSGSSLSQPSIGTKALPPPSWCLVGIFAMRSP